MAKAKVNEVIVGRGTITNVGYNSAGNTSLIATGTSLEVYGAKFVVSIKEGQYASYSPQYYTLFMGKTVVFSFEEVDSVRKPINPIFIEVEGV